MVVAQALDVKVKTKDILTLSGQNWMNDIALNAYINLIIGRSGGNNYPSVYAFNTFFYAVLVKGGHTDVRNWTTEVSCAVWEKAVDVLKK